MTLWIGNLVVFGLSAVLWPLSYTYDEISMVYVWSFKWAKSLGLRFIPIVFTLLLTAGILVPSDKTAWESFVVYVVTQFVIGGLFMAFEESAKLWYMWGDWEEWTGDELAWCVTDANSNCIECEDGDENCINGYEVAQIYWSLGI